MLEGLDKIYLTLSSGEAFDAYFDDGNLDTGVFRKVGEFKQIDYAINEVDYPDLFYIDLTAKNIDQFVEKYTNPEIFNKVFKVEDQKLFFNLDLTNAATLLDHSKTIKEISIPVDNSDLDRFVSILRPLIPEDGIVPIEAQQTDRGDGYTNVTIKFNGVAEPEQILAFHRFVVDIERRTGTSDSDEISVKLGPDYATVYRIAQAKINQGFHSVNSFIPRNYFDENDGFSLLEISAERFDAYASEAEVEIETEAGEGCESPIKGPEPNGVGSINTTR